MRRQFASKSAGWLVVLLLAAAAGLPSASTILAQDVLAGRPGSRGQPVVDIRAAVGYLASDALEGRGIATPGLTKAAGYVADAFDKLGLSSLPDDTRFQRFTMTTAYKPGSKTGLIAARAGGSQTLKPGEDFVAASFSGEDTFDGEAVFAGYGISSKDHHYDDYADIDVKGKVVVVMRYEPHQTAGGDAGKSQWSGKQSPWSPEATLDVKARQAADHGAAAMVLVNPPTYHEGDDLLPFARQFHDKNAKLPVVHAKQAVVDAWLKSAGLPNLASLQKQIDESSAPASAPLAAVRLAGQVEIVRVERDVANVVGILPGQGDHADEYVVVGAHYDHLGHGGIGSRAPRSSEIHNGADDNASGTAAMLKLAERFSRRPPPARSIIFVAFTAEEEGLIGSGHFVSHPPVPLEKIVAMLNLDMVGRVQNKTLYVGGGGTAANFDELLKTADAHSPLEFKDFGKGGFGPSDHMSFALKHVPVLFLFSGLHSDYHTPTDDVEKINFEGMDQAIDVGTEIVQAMLTMPRQAYVATNDHAGRSPGDGRAPRVTLGVVPDYGADAGIDGVRISGAVPNSPAAKAGLKEGDILVQWDDKAIKSLYDLTDFLADGKAGQTVKIIVKRGDQQVTIQATLAQRG